MSSATKADVVLLALLGLSLSANVASGLALFSLASWGGSGVKSSASAQAGVELGAVVPHLDFERLDGKPERIEFDGDGAPLFIYVFTPSCSWCARNLENFRHVVVAARASHRIIAVSLDGDTVGYPDAAALNIPIYRRPSPETVKALRLGPTPQSFVISGRGTVLKSWRGAYSGQTQHDVEEYFNTHLPGLVAKSAGVSR